jgi:hypothetical protein
MTSHRVKSVDLSTLVARIAQSEILPHGPTNPDALTELPAGFDEVDAAILDWIASCNLPPSLFPV